LNGSWNGHFTPFFTHKKPGRTEKLTILITLFDSADGIIVCDGNKRIVACLERTKEAGIGSLVLPVFMVSAK
jgi:hypothetical protein